METRDIICPYCGNLLGQMTLDSANFLDGKITEEDWSKRMSGFVSDDPDCILLSQTGGSLEDAQEFLVNNLELQVKQHISDSYDRQDQDLLISHYMDAKDKNQIIKQAYISSALKWRDVVLSYKLQKKKELLSAQDAKALLKVTFDLKQFDALNPKISVETAIGMNS